MTDYTQITDFSVKDGLSSGDAEKIILGSDVDAELAAISTAIATKVDEPSSPSTNDVLTWSGSAVVWQSLSGVPVGTVVPYAGTSEPSGWLFCDGRSLAQTGTYAALYAVTGTTYGNSAGGSNFDLPDLRFRVPVAPDDMGTAKGAASRDTGALISSGDADTEGSVGGEAAHTLTVAELANHDHTLLQMNPASLGTSASGAGTSTSQTTTTSTTSATGSNSAHNTMQPFIVLNYIIKY